MPPQAPIPDLTPHIPEGWDAPIVFDSKRLEFRVSWTNQGQAMGENYSIVLLLDDDLVYQWYKPVIAPGSVKTQRVSLEEFPDPLALSTGSHHLKLVIDPYQSVDESDERNNAYSLVGGFTFQLPDLEPYVPESLSWDAPVVFGDANLVYGRRAESVDGGYFMAYSVINSGGKTAKAWNETSRMKVGDIAVNQRFADSNGNRELPPGHAQISAVPIWKITLFEGPLLTGRHKINWVINEDQKYLESDKENNILSMEVQIHPSRSRTVLDQPDEMPSTIHTVYLLPADGVDEQWDINGTIESIVGSMQSWLRERTNGRGLRLDSAKGELDISFVRLPLSRAQMAAAPFTGKPLMDGLYALGFNDLEKIYAVWYPYPGQVGESEPVCGFQSSKKGVRFAFSFFERVPETEHNRCVNQDTTMLHEIFHGMGVVAACAPNYLKEGNQLAKGHVGDDRNDLMYAGDNLGVRVELDQDSLDYFEHNTPGCPDAADSPFLEPRS